ncbi:MAG: ankyrin repeat domain-containing protein [Bacteroidales bacterium]|nr:ankyrin repeat domain-containing protein [Bacteroidales bacterium]MCF8351993.1 ankyrin repeat domain-containing protein [Bacteroidales bacterium]MCF8377032.1 ankyrin repeat domain-containing protein [Bacteroidales bacterium]MCF8400889.1 ankyrin repeat domain-containing protein [Bacteroidales bacterium]
MRINISYISLFIISLLINISVSGQTLDHDMSELKDIIRKGKTNLMRSWLEQSGDPEYGMEKGEAPLLHFTIKYDKPQMAKLLLLFGADPGREVKNTPLLHWAIKKDRYEIARLMLLFGADVNQPDKDGDTPLILATWKEKENFIKLLLNFGADVYKQDKSGYSAVDYATYAECHDVSHCLKAILKQRANLKPEGNYHDSPHVFWLDDTTLAVAEFFYNMHKDSSFRLNQIVHIPGDSVVFNTIDGRKFTVYREKRLDDDNFKNVEKILAVNDIHGNLIKFINLLKNNNVINDSLNWIWGKGHLVIIGDVFDRGNRVTETLWLIYQLEQQAKRAGGGVHYLLGNHELMIMNNNATYVSTKYRVLKYQFDLPYPKFFTPNTELGKWLRTKNTMVKLNDNLFVHGGISWEFYENKWNIGRVNKYGRQLSMKLPGQKLSSRDQEMISDLGPYWYRGYVVLDWQKDEHHRINQEQLEQILDFYNVDRIFIGHTLAKDIQMIFDRQVVAVSSPFQELDIKAHGILIEDNKFYKLEQDRKKTLLFKTDSEQ